MKDFKEAAKKHLVGKDLTICTILEPSKSRSEILDDEGEGTGEFEETSGEENYVYGTLDDVSDDGTWLLISQTYRGTEHSYLIPTKAIISIHSEQRSAEAQARDAERAKSLAASRSKTKPRQAK